MALSSDQWLKRYRARIVHHRPEISGELLNDYATIETYEVMRLDFADDPEMAVDIDPDLAYPDRSHSTKTASPARPGRRTENSSKSED